MISILVVSLQSILLEPLVWSSHKLAKSGGQVVSRLATISNQDPSQTTVECPRLHVRFSSDESAFLATTVQLDYLKFERVQRGGQVKITRIHKCTQVAKVDSQNNGPCPRSPDKTWRITKLSTPFQTKTQVKQLYSVQDSMSAFLRQRSGWLNWKEMLNYYNYFQKRSW